MLTRGPLDPSFEDECRLLDLARAAATTATTATTAAAPPPPPLRRDPQTTHSPAHIAALSMLRGYRIGPKVHKDGATHQMELDGCEGRSYFKVSTVEDRLAVKKAIIDCWLANDPLPLSEIAPPLSRLFFDIDTNKKDGDVEVTLAEVIEFVEGLQCFLDYLRDVGVLRHETEGAVHVLGCPAQTAGEEFAFIPRRANDGDEEIEPLMFGQDVAYILASDLKKRTSDGRFGLASYHVVFPLLFGARQEMYKVLSRAFSSDVQEDRVRARLRRAVAGSEVVLRHIDLEVIQRGFLRAPFCDKLGAHRPYEPIAIVDRQKVLFKHDTRLLEDFALAFNATTLLFVPSKLATAQLTHQPWQQQQQQRQAPRHRLQPDQDGPNRIPSVEDKTQEQWRELFYTTNRAYNAAETAELVRRIYETYAADENSTQSGFLEAVEGAVGYVFNHFIAVLRGRQKVTFVTKLWAPASTTPEYTYREEKDAERLYSNSKVSVVWPPPSRAQQGGEKRKTIVIAPFKLWEDSPHRLEFSTVVVKPPGAVPQAAPDDLNLWVPPAVSRERCMGESRRATMLAVNPEWTRYCREWFEETRRTRSDSHGGRGHIPQSAADDKFARPVFSNNEISVDEDGNFYRRFDTNTFLRHIHDILCAGNDKLYTFMMSWFAMLVQKPGHRLRSCIIIVGEEGCGKNFVVDTLGAILGPNHYISTASHSDLGRFNSLLCGKTLLLLNECSRFSNTEEGVLRALITEGSVRVEQKFKDPIMVDNLVNVICVTNITTHNLFSTVSANARRWCMARSLCAPTREEDALYWEGLWKWLGVQDGHSGSFGSAPGVLAFADYLYNFHIPEDWNSGAPPATEELNLHKLGGMNEVAHWWHECLLSGRIIEPATNTSLIADSESSSWAMHRQRGEDLADPVNAWAAGPITVDLEKLYQGSFVRSSYGKQSGTVTSSTLPWFKKQLQELGAFYVTQPRTTLTRRRQTVIYQLAVCREHFCEKYKLGDPATAFEDGVEARKGALQFHIPSSPPLGECGLLDGAAGKHERPREEAASAAAGERWQELQEREAAARSRPTTTPAPVTITIDENDPATANAAPAPRPFIVMTAADMEREREIDEVAASVMAAARAAARAPAPAPTPTPLPPPAAILPPLPTTTAQPPQPYLSGAALANIWELDLGSDDDEAPPTKRANTLRDSIALQKERDAKHHPSN